MKKFSFILVGFALLVGLATPTWADEVGPKQEPKVDLSVEYSPMTFTSSGTTLNNAGVATPFNLSGSLSALKFRGQYTFENYIKAGAYFTTTVSNSNLSLNNTALTNTNYNDLEVFARVPFNVFTLSEQTSVQKKPSDGYVFVAYKNTQLTANVGGVNTTFVNGNGFGGGLGFDTSIDNRWGVGGEAGFYPSQNLQSAGNAVQANAAGIPQVTYTEFIYRLNFHGRFSDPGSKTNWGGSLGFQGGQQNFNQANISYNGFTAGLDLKF